MWWNEWLEGSLPVGGGVSDAHVALQLQGTGTAGTQQIVALPAQGLLPSGAQAITIQTKPGASPSQKVLTIVGTSASAASTPTLARVAGHQGVTVVTTQVSPRGRENNAIPR